MRFKKREPLFSVLDTGLYLLDSLRERRPDNVDDIKDRVRDTYDTASDRVSRATDALRGEEDSHLLGKVGALLIGSSCPLERKRDGYRRAASNTCSSGPRPAQHEASLPSITTAGTLRMP